MGMYNLTTKIEEMLNERDDPYVSYEKDHGRFQVWLVDGQHIRSETSEEFTNFGQHYRFQFIPINEFWIDYETDPKEREFFIRHMAVEYEKMKAGASYDEANQDADAAEGAYRKQTEHFRSVEYMNWFTTTTGQGVVLVNGREVRDIYDVEFTEGGNHQRYNFIPEMDIWIDQALHEDERLFTLFHEWYEEKLMKRGEDYDSAHRQASRLEAHARKDKSYTWRMKEFLGVPKEAQDQA